LFRSAPEGGDRVLRAGRRLRQPRAVRRDPRIRGRAHRLDRDPARPGRAPRRAELPADQDRGLSQGFAGRSPARTSRHSHHTVAAISTLTPTTSASHGCAKASASAPTTAASSPTEAVQLLTGSGEVLSSAREPDLSRWLASATPAPVASMPAP